MNRFAVWAPAASRVELCIEEERRPLIAGEAGTWSLDLARVPADTDYMLSIDGGPPRPDPRSGWQPYGVHAASRRIDHGAFPWTDAGFRATPIEQAVFYEMHVGTFTPAGRFTSAIERLDHLTQLGVTHLELMPVAAFAGERGWGYDGVCLYAPHPAYGSPDDLKHLVDAAHARRLTVILDVVYNHFGPAGNYLPAFGPYFTSRHHTPWGDAVNLDDAGSEEVRRFFIDSALQWLGLYHFDGLRLDAVHAFVDQSPRHFVAELTAAVHELGRASNRTLVVVAESDLNDPRVVLSHDEGGWGGDAQWSDDFHHALHALLTGERSGYYVDFGGMAPLAKALVDTYVYDGAYSASRERRHGRPATGVPPSRFLAYAQNHDQVGNRARGERLSQLVSVGRLEIAAAVVLLSPFLPMLFQGEEWGASTPFQYFTDHEGELGIAVTQGRRHEFVAFGWDVGDVPDPQASATFDRSKLDWSELAREPHRHLFDWHRRLVELRGRLSKLGAAVPCAESRHDETAGWFRFDRGPLSVAFHLGADAVRVPLPPASAHRLLLGTGDATIIDGTVRVAPDAVAVVLAEGR
jgi:maltooligosyltrehalose trehalohydrolase